MATRLGVCGLALLTGLALNAADWPRWRGPENTGHVPVGERVPEALPAAAKPLWRVPVGAGMASPVVAGGRVFHLDHVEGKETAHALDADTGRELWRAPLDDVHKDYQSEPGPRCTPTVDGDRVYVQSCRGEFRCLAADDGRTLWRLNYVKDFGALFFGETGPASGASRHGNTAAPLVDGDRIYVAVGGRDGASVVCLDKRGGTVSWRSQSDTAGYAALYADDFGGVRQVLAFTAVALIGLDAKSGDLLWRVPVKTSLGRHITTPIVAGNLVIVSTHEAGLLGIRVNRRGDTFAADTVWTSKSAAINCSSPVLVGEHLYGIGPSKRLECVDIRTGVTAWSEGGFAPEPLKRDWAAFLVLAGRILVLGDNGWLVLFEADPLAFRPVGRLALCGPNWCSPAYADGRLYLRDEKELLCVALLP
jgi:outer membrane protein assembly factor BamB